MRYRVDFEGGYASFDEKQKGKAERLYKQCGIRMRLCEDLYDEGIVIKGRPIVLDLTLKTDLN